MEKIIEEKWFTKTPDGIRLVGSKCRSCDKVFFPVKKVCPDCYDGQLTTVQLSTQGKLHAFTRSEMGPTTMEKPYYQGFIELPENIKLFSLLTGCESVGEGLKVDMEMEMVIDRIFCEADGTAVMGYKFRPLNKEARS